VLGCIHDMADLISRGLLKESEVDLIDDCDFKVVLMGYENWMVDRECYCDFDFISIE